MTDSIDVQGTNGQQSAATMSGSGASSSPSGTTAPAVAIQDTANEPEREKESEGSDAPNEKKEYPKMDLNMRNCPKVEKLKSAKEYLRWSKQMEMSASFMGVSKYLKVSRVFFQDDEWNERASLFTMLMIQQSVGDKFATILMDEVCPNSMWMKIQQHCAGNVLQEKTLLTHQLERFQVNAKEPIEKEMDRFLKLRSQLKNLGADLQDYGLIQRILTALPHQFSDFKMHKRYNPTNETLEAFMYSVRAEATRLKCWEKPLRKKKQTESHGVHLVLMSGMKHVYKYCS